MDTAIQSIYRDLEYAKSLIKGRQGKVVDDAFEDSEESWTFIGDDTDPELVKRIHGWDAMAHSGLLQRNAVLSDSEGSANRETT